MAERHSDDESGSNGISRRDSLRLAGTAALSLGTLSVLGGNAAAEGEFGTVVDLGEEGLSSGDEIDPYIDQHFQSGNEVHIPPGEYQWNGTLDGPSSGDAALIGDGNIGDVVFNVNDTLSGSFSHDSGTVLFRNVTFKGSNPSPKAGIEFSVGGTLRFEHIRAPDGATQEEDRFLYASRDHTGIAYVRNCYWQGFANNGAYTDNGRVIYENCVAHNNNIAGIRIGTGDSEVYNSLIIIDETPPTDGANSSNGRGIRVREPGTHVIENCDFVYRGVSGAGSPVELRASETAGVMRNCRVLNETDQPVVRNKSDNADWSVENVHLSGDGNLEMEGVDTSSVVTGSSADAPRTDFAEFLGAPIDAGTSETTTDTSTEETTTSTPDDYENVLSLHASPDNPDENLDVSVTVSGDAEFADEAEPDTDQLVSNDDGSTTLTSVGLDPDALDSYMFDGEIVDYTVTDGYVVDVSLNGSMTTWGELVGDGSSGDSSTDSTDDGSTSQSSTDDSTSDDGSTSQESSTDSSSSSSSDLPNELVVDSRDADEVTTYTVTVSGDIERDDASSTGSGNFDDMEDIARDGKVLGVVHDGTDVFRYSGEVTAVSFDGSADVTFWGV
ncbi:hypothetical protein [Haloarchaeobius sp. HRN-SO-5]|uniref:hypothetical protein n=1 Tax=Haloarchaeobius sp. HRN-SO-5 TaxID=3446118 RepID=UPI003EC014B9